MFTNTLIRSGSAIALAVAATAVFAARSDQRPTAPAPAPAAAAAAEAEPLDADELEFIGNAGHVRDSKKPKLAASFPRESYGPGAEATLVVADTASGLSVQIFHAGREAIETVPNDVMLGVPVTPARVVGSANGRRAIRVRIGDWPSGVYYARLTARGGRVGYAPFVLRPRRLGEHRVAVVMPTETWQAYNFRDDDGDGKPNTWYSFGHGQKTARLGRPFLNRGVPPHWSHYDAPFIRWLEHTGRRVDYLSDAELRAVGSGDRLAAAYDLIIFSGHHEYVTTHEYDVVERYRDLGGNLMFLAANNFFWKIDLRGSAMTRVAEWRDLGRPEAALIGVQYRANDRGGHRAPWLVRHVESARWLFAGLHLENGDALGSGAIEIDATAPSSPASVTVVAEIPDLYGPGYTAQMTYYVNRAGAKVFAAGAFTLAGSVWTPEVAPLMANLWQRLARP
jgi:hypothetical protein